MPDDTNNAHADLIRTFYGAFGIRDGDAMAACYTEDIEFSDPAFGELKGKQAKDMWRMLCRAGKDLEVVASGISANNTTGIARWNASYTFATKRKIHNVVDSSFEFRDGLICRQRDEFNFGSWAGQAFGPPGGLLAKTPVLPFTMRRVARFQLAQFSKHHPS
jgi:ketosteroid isomerase-like protein